MAKKINKKRILDELKKEKSPLKRNVTFSLPETLLSKFKSDCDKYDLKMNKVIQKLIEEFIS